MNADKLKQFIGLFGGFLSAVLLFLGTLNVKFEWFNATTIEAFIAVLIAFVPFVLLMYGVYKNSYVFSEKAKKQERVLKQKGLK